MEESKIIAEKEWATEFKVNIDDYQPIPITDADKKEPYRESVRQEAEENMLKDNPVYKDYSKEETVEEAAGNYFWNEDEDVENSSDRIKFAFIAGRNYRKQQSTNQYNKGIEDAIYIIKERMFLIDSYILSGQKNHDEFDFTAELTDLINNLNHLKTK